jgi:hypothetical protein
VVAKAQHVSMNYFTIGGKLKQSTIAPNVVCPKGQEIFMMTSGCPAWNMDRNGMDAMGGEIYTQIPLHCIFQWTHLPGCSIEYRKRWGGKSRNSGSGGVFCHWLF